MADESYDPAEQHDPADQHDSVGAWAKKYHLAARASMEAILRQYDLGSTQWYVLYQLATVGPTVQRDLAVLLHIERATLSGVVAALVRKGLVAQSPAPDDQRQRILTLTPSGAALWATLPDPVALTHTVSFTGADPADLATARRVLQQATRRLTENLPGGSTP